MRKSFVTASSLVILTAVLTIGLIHPGLAEDPEESILAEIDQGRADFVAGKTQSAMDHLQKAVALMQQMAVKGLASFLPTPPEGWKGEEPQTNSGSWGTGTDTFQWNSASRSYSRESDGVRVEALISTSPQLVAPQKQMLKIYRDPQMLKMMNQDPSTKIEFKDKDGWEALSVIKAGSDAAITAFKGKTMITLSVSNGSAEILGKFWDAFDLKGLGGTLNTDDE